MSQLPTSPLTRRSLLLGTSALAAATALPVRIAQANPITLTAQPAHLPLIGQPDTTTRVWAFNGAMPGPTLRLRQGDQVDIAFHNQLDEDTTVHFHGIRLPNAMDGVPHLTQAPIAPGQAFAYRFAVPDAGTYWYHPHVNSAEQLGRGLAGAFIVEEREPIAVDRDLVWLLQDWRLTPDAQITEDFRNLHDMAHAGRLGNTVTLNGKVPEVFAVQSGERLRLRLVNAANARIFALTFAGHAPHIVAIDGQPVEPHAPVDGRIVLAPGMRIDLILDCTADPGARTSIVDVFYPRQTYRLLDLVYADQRLRDRLPDTPIALPPNPLPKPDLASAESHEIRFNGGMMGQMMMRERGMAGMSMRDMMASGKIWFVNGVATLGHVMAPMLTLRRGNTYVLNLINETAWWHPMHLHGHSFRVLRRNGAPTLRREWQDTVLLAPRESVAIAFVADNPGDWMFHCHILEHQESGMMGVIRVQ
jgi:FtsP/CotA-like multicopper oxidase with cupredoxin domain